MSSVQPAAGGLGALVTRRADRLVDSGRRMSAIGSAWGFGLCEKPFCAVIRARKIDSNSKRLTRLVNLMRNKASVMLLRPNKVTSVFTQLGQTRPCRRFAFTFRLHPGERTSSASLISSEKCQTAEKDKKIPTRVD